MMRSFWGVYGTVDQRHNGLVYKWYELKLRLRVEELGIVKVLSFGLDIAELRSWRSLVCSKQGQAIFRPGPESSQFAGQWVFDRVID